MSIILFPIWQWAYNYYIHFKDALITYQSSYVCSIDMMMKIYLKLRRTTRSVTFWLDNPRTGNDLSKQN